MNVFYFDNAASSWPKPPEVVKAMVECMEAYSANPGRGSHQMAVRASRALFEARKNIAKLSGISNPNDISFALNTTHALNLAIKGFLNDGDHVICTAIEHNSVRRPLEYLKRMRRIEVTYITTDSKGNINLSEIKQAIKPNTRLMVCSHSSNLLGTILPLDQISEIIKKHDVKLLVDAAQSLGVIPVDVQKMGIDMLAFPGHKGLLGPQGTGGLYIHPDIELVPLHHGGTGSKSEDIDQPLIRPDRFEAGTQNTVGIAGLNEGVKYVLNETVERIHHKEWALTQRFMEGLMKIDELEILGPLLGEQKTGIVSFRMPTIDSSELAFILDQHYKIAVRSGYHCTPLAHESVGTLETGAVRASVGYFTTENEIDYFINAIHEIYKQYKG
jgi:cysteine desulfurase family protein